MIKYFYGVDTYGARQAIGALAQEIPAQIHWLERSDLEQKKFSEWVGQTTGLFGQELIVVRDVSALPAALLSDISVAVEKSGAATGEVVLWDRGEADRRSKLWRLLKPHSHYFPAIVSAALVTWIHAQVTERSGKIQPGAIELLVERVGNDRWALVAEIERLLLLTTTIDRALVEQQVSGLVAADVWQVLAAIAANNRLAAVAGVERLLEDGHSELYVLSMVAYQFRVVGAIREGLDRQLNVSAIATDKKLKPFVVEKNLAVARKFTADQLIEILTRILATDFAIKRGKVEAKTGVLMLVLGLVK